MIDICSSNRYHKTILINQLMFRVMNGGEKTFFFFDAGAAAAAVHVSTGARKASGHRHETGRAAGVDAGCSGSGGGSGVRRER